MDPKCAKMTPQGTQNRGFGVKKSQNTKEIIIDLKDNGPLGIGKLAGVPPCFSMSSGVESAGRVEI